MLRLYSKITIGDLVFDYVTDIRILSSWDTLTDTAEITLPTNITNKDNAYIKDIIKVQDAVKIELGYYPNLTTRFIGYVSKVIPESPLKVMCEDESFKLKLQNIDKYSAKNVTLEKLITDNYSGTVSIVDANLGNFRIDRVSMIKVLQEIKNKYKIYSWFRDGILYSGLAYNPEAGESYNFSFQKNIIEGSELVKLDESELNTVAHGISTQKDGTKIEVYSYYENGEIVTSTGNPGGDVNTLSIPNKTKAQLTELTERWLPNLYYSGFKGRFETFGEPAVNHGDVAVIEDLKFPEKNGNYVIKSVMIEFGQGGYRQIIELDRSE